MKLRRRDLLAGAGAAFLLGKLARSETRVAPMRLLLVHKPVGTSPPHYDMADGAPLSYVLEPFAALRDRMVVVDGLQNRKQANTPGEDHANGITTFMTGGIPYRPTGSDTPLAERPSIDHVLSLSAKFDAPVRSLQLTADDRGHQFLLRVISHAGRGKPLPPEESPLAAFIRVFGTLPPAGLTPEQVAGLRAQKQSVLDFTRDDLARQRTRLGSVERDRMDRHTTAIREIERVIQRTSEIDLRPVEQQMRAAADGIADRDHHHAEIARAHFDLVRLAFQLDLTRIACFTWGSWAVNVAALVDGLPGQTYHELSHTGPGLREAMVHRYYNVQLAAFLQTLRDTVDVDGRSLLDNTLVVSWSEMRLGNHTFDNTPIQLFGGAGGRLEGARIVRYPGYSTNDLWRSVLNALGDPRDTFGDVEKNSGRLDRLFRDATVPA
jgi:hypothetical protein